jgi:two-component system response regulator AtoC
LATRTKGRVLVVDDEDDLRKLLMDIVVKAGYEASAASDGEEAIGMVKQTKFDVALLDIQMPGKNGIEVLKFIQENSRDTKTIILTGYADLKNAMDTRQYGALDFISKPYRLEDVLSTIKRVLS